MKLIRFSMLPIAFLAFLMAPTVLRAQDEEVVDPLASTGKPSPIAYAAVSNIERLFTKMDFVFAASGQPALSDIVTAQLGQVRDLKGIDRTKPLGAIIFMKPGIFPQFGVTGFVPVDDFSELLQTMSVGPVKPVKLADTDNRYAIGNEGDQLVFEQLGDYVFLTNDETLLDTELPDPTRITKSLVARYDAAIEFNIGNVPLAMRNFLLDFVRADMEAKMQQQDEEPDGVYRARKASSMSNLQFIEQLLLQGDSLRIGMDVSPEKRKAVFEIDLNARPGSQFAKYLSDAGGKTSYFRSLQNEPSILSAYMSWEVDPKSREYLKEMALGLKEMIAYQIETEPPPEGAPEVRLDGLFDTLADTAEIGALDGFLRFQGEAQGEIVFMASVRVTNGTPAVATIADLINLAQSYNPSDDAEIQLNADAYRGVTLHKVTPNESVTSPTSRAFGEGWSMYFGAGERTLWFAMGSEEAIPAVHKAIDQILDPTSVEELQTTAPFRFTLNMTKWITIWENPERERQGFGKVALENFEKGDDQISIDMTTRENGIRYRVELQEAFLRMVGLGFANAMGIPLDTE